MALPNLALDTAVMFFHSECKHGPLTKSRDCVLCIEHLIRTVSDASARGQWERRDNTAFLRGRNQALAAAIQVVDKLLGFTGLSFRETELLAKCRVRIGGLVSGRIDDTPGGDGGEGKGGAK